MAPRETPKATPKVQRTIGKPNATKTKPSQTPSIKKTTSTVTPLKTNNMTTGMRQRTSTVPKVTTPKENKSVPAPSTVTKSAKKANWKRRPKPAHSGVPVPEKMKRLLAKKLQEADCSFIIK